jgi:hypothetical protein
MIAADQVNALPFAYSYERILAGFEKEPISSALGLFARQNQRIGPSCPWHSRVSAKRKSFAVQQPMQKGRGPSRRKT